MVGLKVVVHTTNRRTAFNAYTRAECAGGVPVLILPDARNPLAVSPGFRGRGLARSRDFPHSK